MAGPSRRARARGTRRPTGWKSKSSAASRSPARSCSSTMPTIQSICSTPRAPGFFRGHLPGADRGRCRGDGDRCCQGVEEQTIKLLEVCRLRATPIITCQQDGPRSSRAAGAARGNRIGTSNRLCAGQLADRHGQRFRGVFGQVHERACCGSLPVKSASPIRKTASGSRASNPRLDEPFGRGPALRHDVDLIRHASTPFDLRIPRASIAGLLRLGNQQFQRAGNPAGADRGRRAAAARRRIACRAAGGSAVFRVRVQDPGQYGSEASRSHRFSAFARGAIGQR